MVTMRSCPGIAPESTLRSVVFPEPVPPEITMFFFEITVRSRKRPICSVIDPYFTRSSIFSGFLANLRIVMHDPLSASGFMMALTR